MRYKQGLRDWVYKRQKKTYPLREFTSLYAPAATCNAVPIIGAPTNSDLGTAPTASPARLTASTAGLVEAIDEAEKSRLFDAAAE